MKYIAIQWKSFSICKKTKKKKKHLNTSKKKALQVTLRTKVQCWKVTVDEISMGKEPIWCPDYC